MFVRTFEDANRAVHSGVDDFAWVFEVEVDRRSAVNDAVNSFHGLVICAILRYRIED